MIGDLDSKSEFILKEDQFSGPNPLKYSNRLMLQDGDSHQPLSINSFTVPDNKGVDLNVSEISAAPFNDIRKSQYQQKRSEYQSVYEDEADSGGKDGKPQFLQLIIAKSLQNNFIRNLWDRTYTRKLHQLSAYQIEVLDDLQFEGTTIIPKELPKNSYCDQLKSFKLQVFTPYNQFIVIWDLFQILTYLMIFFWLPYKISFEIYFIEDLLQIGSGNFFEIMFLIILASDVLIGCNLAFIYKGQIQKDRKRIVIHYFKQYAFVDLVSLTTISIQFFIPSLSNKDQMMLALQICLCVVFYVLRITKINKILAQIQEFFNLNGSLNDLVALMKLTMTILFIAHICGCTWHGIAHYNSDYSWLDAYGFRNASNGSKYNNSIYWATMTMTTVGYGDITPKNDRELIINNLAMFIASIVFAYSVNSIGIFVSNMYKGTMEYSRSVTLINTYMSKNKIQFELQTRIRSYLEYIWQEEQEMNDDEVSFIIKKLSGHLQDELQFQIRGNILKNCKVMTKSFSQNCIKTLLNSMEEFSFSPEERIITFNQPDDCALYIISKGEVEILFEGLNQLGEKTERNSLKFLQQGNYFGEVSFFTGNYRRATAISRGFTTVFKIQREAFLKVVQSFPNDKEKFCELRDRINSGDYSALQINCYCCQSQKHLIDSCHIVHYVVDKEGKIKKELYPIMQKRGNRWKENLPKSANAWINQLYYHQRAKEYTADYYQLSKGTDLEDYESHSNVVNEYEDDSRIDVEVPSSLQYRSNSRTFSRVSQKPDPIEEDDKGNSYMRKQNPPRQTVQTAGFGGNVSLGASSDQYKSDFLEDSSDSSSEEADKVLMSLPAPQTKSSQEKVIQESSQRQMSQKITFIQKDNQEEIIPNRQPSIRSKTYEKRSNDRSLTPEKQHGLPSELEIRNNQRRQTNVKKNTTTKVIVDEERNLTQMDNLTQIVQKALILDKMCIFDHYFPLNNYDKIIKRYARAQKHFGKRRLYPETSLYTFFFMNIKKGWKLRRLGERGKKVIQSMKTFRKVFDRKQMQTIRDFGH